MHAASYDLHFPWSWKERGDGNDGLASGRSSVIETIVVAGGFSVLFIFRIIFPFLFITWILAKSHEHNHPYFLGEK
jgi:hypothetical protein